MLSSAILFTPQSEYAKEMAKWEAAHTQYGPPGRPYAYREYPALLYKASRPLTGGPPLFDSREAADETQRRLAEGQGFVMGGMAKAVEALEQREFAIAEGAANRAFNDRRMSPEAQAEAAQADARTSQHLAALPETPIKRRGRKPKAAEVTA